MKFAVKLLLGLLPRTFKSKILLAMVWSTKELYAERFRLFVGGEVQKGPLRGIKGVGQSHWSGNQDLIAKLLGTYEKHLTPFIFPEGKIWDSVVCVGAGDGYWAVGLANSGRAKNVIAYEMSLKGRAQITKLAERNNCQLEVEGLADRNSLVKRANETDGARLFIFDIEGEEYEMIDDELLSALRGCHLIIETHGAIVERKKALLYRLQINHDVSIIQREEYECVQLDHPVFQNLSEHEALLLLSEGRSSMSQKWLICSPA